MRPEDRLEQSMLDKVDQAYKDVLRPVLVKHRRTLEQIEQLSQAGATGRARVLVRSSGLLEDLAQALATAGRLSAAAIRDGIDRIREVIADDTG